MKQTMIAVKAFSYGSERLQPGQEFEATRQHARLLMALGNAGEKPVAADNDKPKEAQIADAETQQESDSADAKQTENRKRRLSRRDMSADS